MEISKQAEEMSLENNLDQEVNQAYINLVGEEYARADYVADAFVGCYEDDETFTQSLLEDCGELPMDLPSYIVIDWEATAKNIMYDYMEEEGYYFRNI